MFSAENRQFARQTDEIKRWRCETLAGLKYCVSWRFQFGGVFWSYHFQMHHGENVGRDQPVPRPNFNSREVRGEELKQPKIYCSRISRTLDASAVAENGLSR